MPRRISDYPDAFAGWNLISSFGSIISVVATFLFLQLVYLQLVEGKATTRYPWLTPQFYSDTLQTLLNRSYNSLEWALTSPPKPHAFVSLPLQSDFDSELFTMVLGWAKLEGEYDKIFGLITQGIHHINEGLTVPAESLEALNVFKNTSSFVDNGGSLFDQFHQYGDSVHVKMTDSKIGHELGIRALRIKYNQI